MNDRSHTPKGQRARERILASAETLLATRGFHGTSMRDVAADAGLPLATTIYHFARKEQLYAAVLEAIAAELLAELEPTNDLETLARAFARWSGERPKRVCLLLRELLDNPVRVSRAAKLPLAPVLLRSAAIVLAARDAGTCDADDPELAVLHFVGALSYVVAARPTVERIVGAARMRAIAASHERDVVALARRTFGIRAAELPRAKRRAGART